MSARLQFGTMRRYDLTPRQREVLALIAAGKTNAEIAEDLDISLDGAKYHVREILGKLGVESREEAAAAWREFRCPLARLGGWWSSLATLLARPLLLAGVSVLAGGLALALVLLIVSRDSDNPIPAAGVTPAPAPTVTPSPSPSPSATSAAVSRPACTAAGVTFGLDIVPDGRNVIVRLKATGAGECLLVTTAELDIMRPPIDPTPPLPPYANMHRDFHLALEFPFSGVVAEWRWSNWCGPNGQIHLWQAHGAAPGLLFAQRPVDLFPACTDSGAPTTLRLDHATTGFDGDLLPVASCAGDFPGWACEFAQRSVTLVAQGRPDG